MNELESRYLKTNGITINDWNKLMLLMSNSTYLKISNHYSKVDLTYNQYQKLIKKLKDADIIRYIKDALRLNPYLYLRCDCTEALARKLQHDYDGTERKPLQDFVDSTGEIFCYSKYTHNKYRPKRVSDCY